MQQEQSASPLYLALVLAIAAAVASSPGVSHVSDAGEHVFTPAMSFEFAAIASP